MHFSTRPAALLQLCLLAVSPAFAQNGQPCLRRTVIASVVNDRGVTPPDLTRDNFRITYKGQTANPLSVAYSKGPRRVVVLLDASGSMHGQGTGKWDAARAGAWELVTALPPSSKVSLMTFSEKPKIRVAMSPDRKPILDWLNGESTRRGEVLKGATALNAAIQSAIEQLQPAEPGDAIYVVTDGGENASRLHKSKAIDALTSSGIRLFALLVPSGGFVTREEQSGIEDLMQATKDSGGFSKTVDLGQAELLSGSAKERIRLYGQQFAIEIVDLYSLTLQLSEGSAQPQHVEIAVVDGSGQKRKDLFLAYPHQTSSCEVESDRH